MSNKQYFFPECDGVTYHITCTRHPWRRYLELTIDEQCFTLPWGEREEIFRLGDEQAILCVARSGRVRIRLRDGEIPETAPS